MNSNTFSITEQDEREADCRGSTESSTLWAIIVLQSDTEQNNHLHWAPDVCLSQ